MKGYLLPPRSILCNLIYAFDDTICCAHIGYMTILGGREGLKASKYD